MKNLTKAELNKFVKEHTNDDKAYFQSFNDDNHIIYGREGLDNVGVIDIVQALINAVDSGNVYHKGVICNDYGEEIAEDNIIILHGINFFFRTIYFGKDNKNSRGYKYAVHDNVDDLLDEYNRIKNK